MFTHLFKLIWNKKKQNALLLLELLISFIGLCAGFTFMLYPYNNYKIPAGFSTENVWVVNFDSPNEIQDIDSLVTFRESVKKSLLSMNMIQDVSYTSVNIPYSGNGFNASVIYNGNESWGNVYTAEDNFKDILGIKVLEGRWFESSDIVAKEKPVVISTTLKKKLFGDDSALGKVLGSEGSARTKVIGVIADIKDESEYEVARPAIIQRLDTGNMRRHMAMLVKVKPGADAAFESSLYKTVSNNMDNASIEIEHLSDMRDKKNKGMRLPFTIIMIVAGFLLINVGLGIFGVLWYNIHKRRGEIGLRRAVGATGSAITRQLVTEAVLIATLALLVGSVFAIQFPLLHLLQLPPENYVIAIFLAVITIYVLVILCALYPGRQAAAIYPANALHED